MDEKPLGSDSEEEYQFTEPGSMEEMTAPSGDEPPEPPRRPKRKGFLVVGFVVVVAFSVYHLLNFFFGVMPPKLKPTPKVVTKPVKTKVAPTFDTQATENLQNQLTIIENKLNATLAKLSGHENALNTLNNKLKSIESRTDEISKFLENQSRVVATQQGEIGELRRVLTELSKKAVVKRVYEVQAIIPGRVWLKTESGKIVTKREGDKLPGYGVIETIDAKRGHLITSSGDVIRHHPEDS